MKNFYKVSNTIENGPRMDRVKSRITLTYPLLTLLLILMLGAWSVPAWGWRGAEAETELLKTECGMLIMT